MSEPDSTSPAFNKLETAITHAAGVMATLNCLHGQLSQYSPLNREELTDALIYLLGQMDDHLQEIRTNFESLHYGVRNQSPAAAESKDA